MTQDTPASERRPQIGQEDKEQTIEELTWGDDMASQKSIVRY